MPRTPCGTQHRDVDAVLMQVPAGDEPESLWRRGEAAVDAIEQAGVQHVIFNVGVRYPRAVAELPSFEARQRLERLIQSSRLRPTIVRQTFLLQNLLLPWVVQGIAKGGATVYPVRADVELSWGAAEDVGRLAAAVVEHDVFGESIDLGGELALNGDALAEPFAEALGRPIRFVPLPLVDFERGVDAGLGE